MTDEEESKLFAATCFSTLGGAIGATVGTLIDLLVEGCGDQWSLAIAAGICWTILTFPVGLVCSALCLKSLDSKQNWLLMGPFILFGALLCPQLLKWMYSHT